LIWQNEFEGIGHPVATPHAVPRSVPEPTPAVLWGLATGTLAQLRRLPGFRLGRRMHTR
jgi:hypothetical protein